MNPIQYNPATKTLRVYSNLELNITFDGGDGTFGETRLYSASFLGLFDNLFMNPSLLYSAQRKAVNVVDDLDRLIIITPDSMYATALTLMSWKQKIGIRTSIIPLSQVGGSGTAADIKALLQNLYDSDSPPTDILLIGDADLIPTNYGEWHPFNNSSYCNDCQGHIGTDLYYTTLDGDDYYPDVNIGRLSVDTVEEANNRVNRIIAYEKTPAYVSDTFYNNIMFCAEFQHLAQGYAARRFTQTVEDLALFLGNTYSYNIDRVYYTPSHVNPGHWANVSWNFGGGLSGGPGDSIPSHLDKPGFAWDGDSNRIRSLLHSDGGRFLVVHRDHGSTSGWSHPQFNTNDVELLDNGMALPVVWSINCQTGWFDNETDDPSTYTAANAIHFSEAWERNTSGGAVGVLASTRVSYSGHNDRLVWGWTDAIWPDFLPGYGASDKPIYRMGDVLNYGKFYYAAMYGDSTLRKCEFEMFHWFGDPTMEIWTAAPQQLIVSHPQTVSGESIDVVVDQADVLVCISMNGVIYAAKRSTGAETMTLTWTPPQSPFSPTEPYIITAKKHNYKPYEGTFTKGDAQAALEGYVYHGFSGYETPMSEITAVTPEFSFYDQTNSQWYNDAEVVYNISDAYYAVYNLPSSSYKIHVRYTINGTTSTLPGNYRGSIETATTSTTTTPMDIYVDEILHLAQPYDNNDITIHTDDPYPTYTSPLGFIWDYIPTAAMYQVRIHKVRDPDHPDGYGRIETVVDEWTDDDQYFAQLAPSNDYEHYEMELYAYKYDSNIQDYVQVGYYMTTYTNGYGWDYRFKIDQGTNYFVRGHVFYNGAWMSNITDIIPEMTVYDRTAGKWYYDASAHYDPADSLFTIQNLPGGEVQLVFIYHLMGDKDTLPGNYRGYVIVDTTTSVYADADTQIVMHLTQPWDNENDDRHTDDPYLTYYSPIGFNWDPVSGAAVYEVNVLKYRDPDHPEGYGYIENVVSQTYTTTSCSFYLDASATDEHYEFDVKAYADADATEEIGYYMTTYSNGYGWDFRFKAK